MITDLTSEYTRLELDQEKITEVDLGCGSGSFILQLAQAYPERQFIAVDVMIGRLRSVESKCRLNNINNINIYRSEAWHFFDIHLADNSLDRLHVLCPDPWPKKRHAGHRLLNSEFLSRAFNKLKPGGCLHLATDHSPYFEQMKREVSHLKQFVLNNDLIDDIREYKTDFEKDFLEQGIAVNHASWMANK